MMEQKMIKWLRRKLNDRWRKKLGYRVVNNTWVPPEWMR